MDRPLRPKDQSNIILKYFKHDSIRNTIKIYDKTMFLYPKRKKTKSMFWENHNIIDINTIINYIKDLIEDPKYSNVKIIHPFLFLISWNKINKYFVKKRCISSNLYEIIPKVEYKNKINYTLQTREILKIISLFMNNKLFINEFNEFFSYLCSEKGIIIQEFYTQDKHKYINIKIAFSNKIFVYLQINNHIQSQYSIDIFLQNGIMPIQYFTEKQDMTNLLPLLLQEFTFSIAKKNIQQAIKFHLIMIDHIEPYWAKFSIDNIDQDKIYITDIKDILELYGMNKITKYIKTLIINNILEEDEHIFYNNTDVLKGYVSQIGLDIIFMRLDNKYFQNTHNFSSNICTQYSIIKQKYFKTLKNILSHQNKYFNIILENRNKLFKLYENIKPINPIIHEMIELFYKLISSETRQEIYKTLNIELHTTFIFLVRQEGKYIDLNTFKKISKYEYHKNEESSSYICNFRWITTEEWILIKEFINKKIYY